MRLVYSNTCGPHGTSILLYKCGQVSFKLFVRFGACTMTQMYFGRQPSIGEMKEVAQDYAETCIGEEYRDDISITSDDSLTTLDSQDSDYDPTYEPDMEDQVSESDSDLSDVTESTDCSLSDD